MPSSAELIELEINALFNTLSYSIICNYKKDWKEDLGSYTLISVLEKVREQIILSATMQHTQTHQWVRPIWCEFMRGRSCLIHCASFHEAT